MSKKLREKQIRRWLANLKHHNTVFFRGMDKIDKSIKGDRHMQTVDWLSRARGEDVPRTPAPFHNGRKVRK
jgi:hypothetical protein